MPASDDLALILAAARDAGRIALRHWNQGPVAWEKPDGEGLVTEADLAVDAFLRETLLAARPDYGWLSEESLDDHARLDRPRTFIVDPIDGTRAFANGERTWAVSVAVAEAGRALAGVVHLPARTLTYTAAEAEGAWLNGTLRLSVTGRDEIRGAEILAARPTLDALHWPGGLPPVKREFRSSLAYRLALVGEGRFDAMAAFRPTWEWDIAAGILVASEAGATVSDGQGAPIALNTLHRQSMGILVGTPAIHAALLTHRTPQPA